MKLFSEKIQHLYTNAPINVLRVESFEEVFLDIFEVLINDSKYLAEKVGEYYGNPIVNIPTSIGEETFIYPWVLAKGNPEVLFNENNILVIENDVSVLDPIPQEEIEEDIVFEHVEKDPEIRVIFQPSRIEEYLDEAKLEELELSNKLKKKKLEEQKTKIENNKRFLIEHAEKTKDELVESFVVISEKVKEEIFDYYKEYEFKADHLLSECSDKLIKELKKELKLGMTDHSTQLESKLKKFVKHIYDNIISEKIQIDIKAHINRGFNLVEKHLDVKFLDIITEDRVSELLDEKIIESTTKTSKYFDDKISYLQEQSIELDAKSRKYIIDLVNESKANLISEIRKIKDEKPVEYIIESRGTQQKKNFDDISKDIDKIISSKISTEVLNLRKYVAVYSGGGSVAMQFADGGIMNGDLSVNGTVTSDGLIAPFLSANSIQFNTSLPIVPVNVGELSWNNEDGTLELGLKGGNVTLQIGQENVVRAVNKTSENLLESEYKVVRIRTTVEGGAQGQRLAVVLAQANNDPNSVDTIGLVTENIIKNEEGFVTTSGLVRNINTTGSLQGETWNDGDVVYLSPSVPGKLTNIKPMAPNHTVVIGFIVHSHQNAGKIFVKVDNGYEIDELHNVRISSLSANSILAYNKTDMVWENRDTLNIRSLSAINSIKSLGPIVFPSVSVSSLSSYNSSQYTGGMVFVTNESGGSTMAFYDGANWRRVQDRLIVS